MEHLPECAAPQDFWRTCICDALHAYEQRVMQDAKEWEANAYSIGFTVGKNKALDAAREALTEALNALPIKWTSDELFPAVLTIHRVFDSLKEKP